ncbi:MAG TPA: fibronectin type III domain-containing protein, partial [Prolixibacteraceae bacterium]|nr:fibronectin type III domain-containing protein [Prolixibacteraceae bacterium]
MNQLSAAIDSSEQGEVIILMTDGGTYEESASLNVNKRITIETHPSIKKKPIIFSHDGGFIVACKADMNLKGIVFDGSKGTAMNLGGITMDSSGIVLKIEDCEFLNFGGEIAPEGCGITNTLFRGIPDSLHINGCIFKNCSKSGLFIESILSDPVNYIQVKNSTFTNIPGSAIHISGEDELNMQSVSSFHTDHCTFYILPSATGISVRNAEQITVNNCIAYTPEGESGNAFELNGREVLFAYSVYFNSEITLPRGQIIHCRAADPLFVEPGYGDFMLFNDSPAIQAGEDEMVIGDPRWGISPYASCDLICIKEPYSLSPTTSSVRIMWQTPERRPVISMVEYGKTAELGKMVMGDPGRLIEGEGYIHEVTLTGLDPFTEYFYRVSDGTKKGAKINITKTAPLKGTDFRLLSLSDIHNNSGGIWETISKRALQDSSDLAVVIGDCVNNGNIRTTWESGFFIPGEPLLRNCVFLHALGNHDTDHGPTTYYDYFSLPVHSENGDEPEAYYSADYGDVKI